MLPENSMEARATIARAARDVRRNPDDDKARAHLDTLRAEYHARQLEEHIRRVVADAPALTTSQRSRLAVLLGAVA